MTATSPSAGAAKPLDRVFCISCYEGNLDILSHTGGRHVVYFKGEENRSAHDAFDAGEKYLLPNVGFNIFTYLTYIVDHYDRLPSIVVFCKNNVFPRHVREAAFVRLSARNVFTPIVDRTYWHRLAFPVSVLGADAGYLELADEHYAHGRTGRYFSRFVDFHNFVFADAPSPAYVGFAPGANYVVPRENILLRSRAFYDNLRVFVAHAQHSLESYFVERDLETVWSGLLEEAPAMSRRLDERDLAGLESRALARRLPRRALGHPLRKLAQIGAGALFGLLVGRR